MSIVALFGIIVVVLSFGAFVSARRFGALALGLAAGSVLSSLWSEWLASLLASYGLGLGWLPAGVLSTVSLLLAPLVLLLMSGPKYSSRHERLFSAIAIGLLTAAFLVQPFGQYMVLDGNSLDIYRWLSTYWQYFVTAGLVLGVIDLFLLHSKKSSKHDKKH